MKTAFFLLISMFATAVTASVDLVKVDKSERQMFLLDDGKVVKTYAGGSPEGHKQQEGDERTPEGLYTLDYKKEDSSYYRSMHISYPNQKDIQKAESLGVSPGGFIMIHGQRNRLGALDFLMQRFDWTDGCIAITNQEMDEFMELVSVGTKIQIEW
ncbi:MAG: L,D-transpeptidase family protein [Endozoicomonas sp.]|uniref:L,D-transpeptidase family protein n=1 Tax=Endozoicomonas sp. TaxID=1892382 RepID=UPI003D9B3870